MRNLKDILGKELYIEVKEKLGDKKIIISDENYIPRSRLNQVINEKNIFRKDLEALNTRLKDIKAEMKIKDQYIKGLEDSKNKLVKESSRIKDICLTNAIKLEALKMNAKNIHVTSTLIDKTKLNILEDGTVKGLEEQLGELKKSQREMFGEDILISLMNIQALAGNLIQRKLMENL